MIKIMEASRSIYMPALATLKDNLSRVGCLRRAIFQMSRYSSRYDLYLQGKNPNTFNVSLANGAIMDMYAMSSDGHSLNVVLENLNVLQSIALTEKAYAEATVGQLPAALESMGIKNVTAEITEMTFAGENHVAIKLHGILQDYDFSSYQNIN